MRVLLVFAIACGATTTRPSAAGGIAGIVRDRVTGALIANAELEVARRSVVSDRQGFYVIERLPVGHHDLVARFAGTTVKVTQVPVRPGILTSVDISFELGQASSELIQFGALSETKIARFRPAGLASSVSILEGTVMDLTERTRVAGAVITVVGERDGTTHQTVSDDRGQFRLSSLAPGSYTVSAYYSVAYRGHIELRRAGIEVAGGEVVSIPMWLELAR